MYCPKCGKENPEGARFCMHCKVNFNGFFKKYSKYILFLILIFLFFSIGIASAKTWYVDDSGGADFTEIQDAVDAASKGDAIIVKDGTYIENVIVNKSLTIKSERGGVRIKREFEVTTNYVNIERLTLEAEEYTALYVEADYCKIFNNIILGGMTVHGDNNVIWKNFIKGGDFITTGLNVVFDNKIQNCETCSGGSIWEYDTIFFKNDFINSCDRSCKGAFDFPIEINYTYNLKTFTGKLGNYYYDSYRCSSSVGDKNDDGVGDKCYIYDPCPTGHGSICDSHPLVQPKDQYEIEIGYLIISSDPSGAKIYLDGKFIGNTPKKFHNFNDIPLGYRGKVSTIWTGVNYEKQLHNILPGRHTVKLCKEGYLSPSESVEVDIGKTININATLTPYGFLHIASSPSDNEVYIDEEHAGKTPLETKLPVGEHSIEIRPNLPYSSWSNTVAIFHNEETNVEAKLSLNLIFCSAVAIAIILPISFVYYKATTSRRERKRIESLERERIRREEERGRLEEERRISELKAKYEQYKREGYKPHKNLEEMLK